MTKRSLPVRLRRVGGNALLMLALLPACSDSDGDRPREPKPPEVTEPEPTQAPFQELFDQGITRYAGLYSPMLTETDGEVTVYSFGTGDGPLCLDGSQYRMSTLNTGSRDLVIYLQGGGACWSTFCAATENADQAYIGAGILDRERTDNPVRDWNQVYLPYCDGGLHGSDRDTDSDGDGTTDRFQRGLHNLSAALDVAAGEFPGPRRILLAGSSGGGLGTTFALPMVRYYYPDVRIDVVNDSGVGVGRPEQADFLELLIDDWNMSAFLPGSCDDCIAPDGHFSEYHIWQMDQDPAVRRGMLSYSRDSTFADFFLQIGQEAWEAALFPEMQQLQDAHPDRSRYWIPAGDLHTVLMREPDATAGGVPILDWITLMLDDSPDWVSVND